MDYYYKWSPPFWDIQGGGFDSIIVHCDLDEPLTLLVNELPERLKVLTTVRPQCDEQLDQPELLVDRPLPPGYIDPMEGVPAFELPQVRVPLNGTLVLALRSCTDWESSHIDTETGRIADRHLVLITGGLGFVEGIHEGIDIGDSDPAYHVEQICLALAGKACDPNYDLDTYQASGEQDRQVRLEAKKKRLEVLAKVQSIAETLLSEHFSASQIKSFSGTVAAKINAKVDLDGTLVRPSRVDFFAGDVDSLGSFVAEQAKVAIEKELARKVVLGKAKAILREHLNEEQQVEFDSTGSFHVQGADGHLYLITDKPHHNVFRIEDGRPTL